MPEGIRPRDKALPTMRGSAAPAGERGILVKLEFFLPILVTCFALLPLRAQAKEQTYLVQPGDSVAEIADHFGVSQSELMEVNDIRDPLALRPGQTLTIPDQLRYGSRGHMIQAGDTLVAIAKRYKVSTKALAELNKLEQSTPLSIGRTLLIPDTQSGLRAKGATKGRGRQPVVLMRIQSGQSAKVLLTNKSGSVNQKGRKVLSQLAAPRARVSKSGVKGKQPRGMLLHPRLVQLLSRVSERFPGRAIQIVSGYRPHRRGKNRSKHAEGRALDFRVEGVANRELYEFIKTLPKTGAGYYPNSTFVHLDTRDISVTWTDYAGPGESARYGKAGASGDFEAMSDAESHFEDAADSSDAHPSSAPSAVQIEP